MGYSTDFVGQLLITCGMTDERWERLESYFGEDVRDHKDWKVPLEDYDSPKFYYINLRPNGERTGIMWDGSEKTYGMVETVQFIIDEMRKLYPEFGLVGVLEAQGEEVGDHWFLIADGDRVMDVTAKDYYVNYEKKINDAKKAITDGPANIEATIS